MTDLDSRGPRCVHNKKQQIKLNVTVFNYNSKMSTGEIKRTAAFCLTQIIIMSLLGKHKQFNTDHVINKQFNTGHVGRYSLSKSTAFD